MKRAKSFLVVILGVIAIACFSLVTACGKDPLSVDTTPSGDSGLSFEYMTDAEIPIDIFEDLSEEDVNQGKVTFVFTSPEYEKKKETLQDVYHSEFPGVFCDVVGEWKVTYVKGNKHDTKTFDVVDTIEPTFDVASTSYDIWFDAIVDDDGKIIDKGSYYELPMIFPNDLSEFDYDTYEMSLILDTDINSDDDKLIEVEIEDEEGYYAPAVGKMTYTVTIADIHGNKSEYVASWNVKDPNWTDENLDEGYLADYNEEGYINTASSGRMSSYWAKSEIVEEHFTKEEFEKATGVSVTSGVLKVSATPTDSYAVGAFKFKLQKTLTKEEVGDKYLVVKFFTPNSVSTVRFGAQTWQSESEVLTGSRKLVEACDSEVIDVIPNAWNFAIISASKLNYGYFQVGDTEIKEFHIAFGERTQSVQDDLIELYIDSVALADKLPEITGYQLNDNVLSWNALEGATCYEVIEDGVKTEVTTNEYTVTNPDGVITVRAISKESAYVSSSYASRFVNVDTSNFDENDLAVFDSDKYELTVEKSFRTGREANSLEVDRLEAYEGVSNVLKVVTTTNAGGIGDFRIKLPKTCTDGITVKFMITQTNANYFYWLNPSFATEKSISDDALVMVNQSLGEMAGKWQYVYIPYSATVVKDVIEVLVLDAKTKAEGVVTEVYFACIMNGDHRAKLQYEDVKPTLNALATNLTGDYLADFSTADYVSTIAYGVSPNRASSITSEYLSTYADANGVTETGVLKITSTNNSSRRGNIRIYLPKESTTGKMTVKFMVAKGSTTMWFINPNTNADEIKTIADGSSAYTVSTTWQYMTLDQSALDKNCIEFLFANSAEGDTNIVYVACVMEGDQVEYLKAQALNTIKAELAESLNGDDLADFSSSAYEKLVANSKYSSLLVASSLTAEYVSSFDSTTNLIKITTVNNGNVSCFGGFAIDLPKDIPTDSGFTVKFYIESTTSRALRIINPSSNSTAVSSSHEWVDSSLEAIVGQWVSIYVPYSATYADAGTVEFMFFMNKTDGVSGTNVIYIDSIVAGNQTV